MNSNLMIKTVMHPLPHSIGAGQTIATARDMMTEHNIRHLPVLEGGTLIGILTDRDIHFACAVDKVPADQIIVRDCFTPEPYIVEGETLVTEVAKTMAHQHIGCTLIVEKGKLIGIFTTVDACRLLSETLGGELEQ
jgi:acetoin utilization protein AcuB